MKLRKELFRMVGTGIVIALCGVSGLQAQLGQQQGLLDPNTAKQEEIAKLPHFDDAKAKDLVAKRPFLSMKQLNQHLTASLTADQVTEVYGNLFLHLNLNTASDSEIRMIPGVGKRMAHEFDEYRPYKSFAQFRKEIGKYVDKKEVARLEQYVFIPIDLNTASDDAIRSIPGMGRRMLHEFKEYRPYKSMAQFRKEIGKYVSDKEVSRFERYVTIK